MKKLNSEDIPTPQEYNNPYTLNNDSAEYGCALVSRIDKHSIDMTCVSPVYQRIILITEIKYDVKGIITSPVPSEEYAWKNMPCLSQNSLSSLWFSRGWHSL
jgi:hypothetical protein